MMGSWEETLLGWTSLGLMKLARTAVAVPIWEYVALMVILTSTWLYYILDFHFVKDVLTGFKGEIPRLLYNPASRIAAQILPKCSILKQRYNLTLSSPVFCVFVSALIFTTWYWSQLESRDVDASTSGRSFSLLQQIVLLLSVRGACLDELCFCKT